LETTERYAGGRQATRKRRIAEQWGPVHEIEVTVYGGKVRLLIDAVTKIPLAVKAVKIREHEALWTRALITQARDNLAGAARLHNVVFDQGVLAGTALGWLDQRRLRLIVPAQDHLAVTADARARGGWRGGDCRPSGLPGPPRAGPGSVDRTTGHRGRGDHGADDI